MQTHELLSYLKNPSLLNDSTLAELQSLVKEYPYCQTYQTLLLKNLQLLHHSDFDHQLKVAGVYSSDRKRLYKYIVQHLDISASKKELVVEEAAPVSSESANTKPIFTTSPEPAQFQENRKKASEILAERLTEIQSKNKDRGYPIGQLPDIILSEITEKPPIEQEEENQEEEQTDQVEIAKDTRFSFNEWLNKVNDSKVIVKEEKEEPETKPVQKKKQIDLIDKFIETDPRIKPVKAEFFSPVNMARKSVVDNEDIVSETLAKIYFQQGNFAKAIQMYEKLSLKFPEKSSFFAAQIEIVQNSLNINKK